jgi:hypothetical protein
MMVCARRIVFIESGAKVMPQHLREVSIAVMPLLD